MSPSKPANLDTTDRRLLAELADDARASNAELGRRLALSAPAVAERRRRLEEAGVITGYRAAIDPAALGYPVAAVVRIRPAVQQLARIRELVGEQPEVVECHRITGDDCFILRVHVRSLHHLEEVLDRFSIYGQTTTSIIQSTPVPARALPI